MHRKTNGSYHRVTWFAGELCGIERRRAHLPRGERPTIERRNPPQPRVERLTIERCTVHRPRVDGPTTECDAPERRNYWSTAVLAVRQRFIAIHRLLAAAIQWHAATALVCMIAVVVCMVVTAPTAAESAASGPSGMPALTSQVPSVVASTTWTAVIARAAGATDISVLAPAELRHPPEYDFRPSDIARVTTSSLLIWAGYEPFIRRLIQAADIPADRVVQVSTMNTPDNLVGQARLLSQRLGTIEEERVWEHEFMAFVSSLLAEAHRRSVGDTRVLVHFHHEAFVRWLGYDVVAVFGPDELSPAKAAELAMLKPDLVIDNYHNPQGAAIAEIAGCSRVELRNFPARATDTIEELFTFNAEKLGLL
jgi:zinc transport system substrate-binding protein